MSNNYKRELLRVAVAQICLTVGYNATQNTPLELLQDVLHKFLIEFARDLRRHVENYNRLEANLNDTLLTLNNLKVNIHELMDYITNVEPVPYVIDVPKFPTKKCSNFNFLKPGSKEVLTRPIHVFEYLPPMLPVDMECVPFYNQPENNINNMAIGAEQQNSDDLQNALLNSKEIKKQKIPISNTSIESTSNDRYSVMQNGLVDEAHPTREISSVVMTTGGFISPAMEGKVPDAIIPDLIEKYQGLDVPPPVELPKPPPLEQGLDTPPKTNKKIDSLLKANDFNKKKKYALEGKSVDNISVSTDNNNLNTSLNSEPSSTFKKELNLGYESDITDKAKRKKLKLQQKTKKNKNSDVMKKNEKISTSLLAAENEEKQLKTDLKTIGKQIQINNDQISETIREKIDTKSITTTTENVASAKTVPRNTDVPDGPLMSDQNKNAPTEPAVTKTSQLTPEPSQASLTDSSPNAIFTNINKNIENTIAPNNLIPKANLTVGKESDNANQDVKLTALPDRSKLDIFKKISKQKTAKDVPAIFANSFLLPPNDNLLNDRSLPINLPMGTTITPSPAINLTNDIMNFQENAFKNLQGLNSSFPPFTSAELNKVVAAASKEVNVENKPKKRGRKPGSKNQPKVPNPNALFNMQTSPTKATNLKTENQAFKKVMIPPQAVNCSEAIPLLNMHDPSANVIDMKKVAALKKEQNKLEKEKKQKKKKKLKNQAHENFGNDFLMPPKEAAASNANFMGISEQKDVLSAFPIKPLNDAKLFGEHKPVPLRKPSAKQFNAVGRPMKLDETSLTGLPNCPPNPNMFPMLPLLAFPTRPGLIPTTSMFPGNPMQLTNPLAGAPPNMLINSLLPFGNLKTPMPGSDLFSPDKPRNESKTSTMFSEHNFCNVPPLIPEFMSLHSKSGPLDQTNVSNMKTLPSPKPKDNIPKLFNKTVDFGGADDVGKTDLIPPQTKMSAKNLPEDMSFTANDVSKNIFQNQMAQKAINDGKFFDFSANTSSASAVSLQPVKVQQQLFNENVPNAPSELIELSDDSNDVPPAKEHIKKNSPPGMKPDILKNLQPMSKNIKKPKCPKKLKKNILLNSSSLDLLVNDQTAENMKGNCYGKLAGGAELIPLVGTSTGLAYSSKTIPTTSLTGSAVINKDVSQIDGNFSTRNVDDITITPKVLDNISLKKKKEHKKLKKLKEGKIKKKKDKKDKIKNKEKLEKYLSGNEKIEVKKNKKNKKKDKQQVEIPIASHSSAISCTPAVSEGYIPPYEVEGVNERKSVDSFAQLNQSTRVPNSPHVPKLTLKFNESKSPKQDVDAVEQSVTKNVDKREPSPELARISPLVTGPPKQKFISEDAAIPTINIHATEKKLSDSTFEIQTSSKANEKLCEPVQQVETPPNPWIAGGTLSASSVLLPQQLLQKPETKKPIVTAEPATTECRPSSYVDAEGNIVWICPACGKVDDGSAMIGCDGCDAWYHWVCVGIFVAPKDNEDWYCRLCVMRKKGTPSTADKKRKRNKKK